MKKYTYDIDVDVWIKNIEIIADSEYEARGELLDMSLEELISEGYVKDFSIHNNMGIAVEDFDDEDDTELDDSVKDHYFLSFDVENSLKGTDWAEMYMQEWCGLDYNELNFDHLLSEKEVRKFLELTIPHCADIFNEYNTGYDSRDGRVDMYFTDIKLYKLNDDLEIDNPNKPAKEYPNMDFSFIAKSH